MWCEIAMDDIDRVEKLHPFRDRPDPKAPLVLRDLCGVRLKVRPKSPVCHVFHGDRALLFVESEELDEGDVSRVESLCEPLIHSTFHSGILVSVFSVRPGRLHDVTIGQALNDTRNTPTNELPLLKDDSIVRLKLTHPGGESE